MIRTIILAGGSGTRFWPLSRKKKPKQLLKLLSNKTLLEETIDRAKNFSDSVAISTGKILEEPIQELKTKCELIVEPLKKDTAAAIGLCSINYDPEDILVFLPADAYIKEKEPFHKTMEKAIKKAEKGITVIGVKPYKISTGYGYIECERGKVKKFKEKPNYNTAKKYIDKRYLWNAGIFVVKNRILQDLYQKHAPTIYENLMKIKEKPKEITKYYKKIDKISFDYAIMEKAEEVYCVKSEFYWNDIGSYDALSEILEGDNVVLSGKLYDKHSSGNIVHSKKPVVLLHCNDMVVVEDDEVIFVCPKKASQEVKAIIDEVHKKYH